MTVPPVVDPIIDSCWPGVNINAPQPGSRNHP
jgi:hypothetical protein